MKSVMSLAAGFILWSVLWVGSNSIAMAVAPDHYAADGSTTSTPLLLTFLVLSVVFSLAAGRVTARLAPARRTTHGVILGVLLTAVGVAVQFQYWDVMPLWFHVPFLVCLLPASWLGAKSHPAATSGGHARGATA